jgi:hypothetical protein
MRERGHHALIVVRVLSVRQAAMDHRTLRLCSQLPIGERHGKLPHAKAHAALHRPDGYGARYGDLTESTARWFWLGKRQISTRWPPSRSRDRRALGFRSCSTLARSDPASPLCSCGSSRGCSWLSRTLRRRLGVGTRASRDGCLDSASRAKGTAGQVLRPPERLIGDDAHTMAEW